MKNKLMIALVILALVFGMVLIACDDGELPKIKEGSNETILDINLLASGVKEDGTLINPIDDTTGYSLDDIIDNFFTPPDFLTP